MISEETLGYANVVNEHAAFSFASVFDSKTDADNVAGIYLITCLKDERMYVGSSSVSLRYRLRKHLSDLRENKHGNSHLQRSFTKHGEDQFTCQVLEECNATIALQVEQDYLDTLRESGIPSFNQCWSAVAPFAGKTLPEESRKKISESNARREVTEETKQRIRNSLLGRKLSAARRASMKLVAKARWQSEAFRQKVADCHDVRSAQARLWHAKRRRPITFKFQLLDGRIISGEDLFDFCKLQELDYARARRVASGELPVFSGFYYPGKAPKLRTLMFMNGITCHFSSTPEFCKSEDLSVSAINGVFRGTHRHHKGWHLPEFDYYRAQKLHIPNP